LPLLTSPQCSGVAPKLLKAALTCEHINAKHTAQGTGHNRASSTRAATPHLIRPDVQGLPPHIQRSGFSDADTPASRSGAGTRQDNPLNAALPLSQPVIVIDSANADQVMMASPSIVKLASGRLLVVHECVPRHGRGRDSTSAIKFVRPPPRLSHVLHLTVSRSQHFSWMHTRLRG
jgi:hypothetical protein